MAELEHEVRNITRYVEGQARGEEVTHAERLISTKVLSTSHEVWDVRTTTDRYWVVTNPTNLYSQDEFRSADYALTFHVGIRVRLSERSRSEPQGDEEQESYVAVAWRKYKQAVDAYNGADEAEAYQAVGIHCRESLIALARHVAAALPPETIADAPKASNFKAWSELAAEHLATGRLRSYLKAISDKSWDLAVWLQHYESATPWDAELVLDATSHTIGIFGMAFHRHHKGQPDRCPRCDSYRVDFDNDILDDNPDVQWTQRICAACEHEWDYQIIRWDDEAGKWVEEPPERADALRLPRHSESEDATATTEPIA
ncbi:hypothetical protein O7627_03010 [Solwaraspora sp. WMMD1047]|uniref:hypothetical protein n=1 Tax=Solwaraspora sp. WMMD1047 TaxID=3016102 RepID=UPI002416C423|nr:hypothetical protein [Solwaraspora sp. WMMD1047]MDG4828274.1 hypothetical protein [Solwaraspora sp. WMMD1047]